MVVLLLSSSAAFAQPVTGLPPFGSFSGGPFDTVNNANLNVYFKIPILNKAGRGQNLSYALSYDSSVWSPVSASGSQAWTPTPATTWGWTTVTNAPQALVGYVTFTTVQQGCPTNPPYNTQWYYWNTYSNFKYVDNAGTSHPIPALSISDFQSGSKCGGGPPMTQTMTAPDGSGYQVTASTWAGLGYAYLVSAIQPNGTSAGVIGGPTGPGTSQDSNGNQISSTAGSGITITDTLGTTALVVAPGTPMTLTYTNPLGTTSHYTVNYTSKAVQTAFGCSSIAEYGPTAVNLVTSIVLPDSTQYALTYEATPGYPNNVTGRIASITLPTGGTIDYTYSGGSHGITCADGSTATLARQTPDGTWTYAHSESANPWTTTITDPASNVTSLSFQGIYEVQRTASTGGSVGLTVSACYNGVTSNCTATAVTQPISQVAVTRTVPSTTSSSVQSQSVSWYNGYGLPTEVDEYDYGTSGTNPQPGGLARKTTTSYASLGNGIVNRPSAVTVYDSSGTTIVAQTSYAYDQSAAVATSGTPQQASVSGSRGNPTAVSFQTGTRVLNRTFTYFDTGNVQTATDTNGAQTTYTYGACGNSFATNAALPLTLSTQAAWNCTGGVQSSVTDANSKTTTATYSDANFWRPASIADPTNATTTISYATSPTATESALNFNGSTSTVDTRTTLDGLGRSHISQKRQGQGSSNYDSVETDYDSLGRPWRVTVPYKAAAGGTFSVGPSTVTYYDALSRATQVMQVNNAGGGIGWTNYTYSQNDILVEVAPAASGESTKKRQMQYDGLGRLTSVCEISSASGSGACGQNVSQTGFLTSYTYDLLNNLHQVSQNVQSSPTQTRTFTYDELGRKTSEATPETSQTATGYTYDTDGTCGTSSGDLVKRVDPVGNVTCVAYDALHRPTALTYSGPYSGVTPAKHYVYDAATVNGAAMANAKGRLAEAYSGPSKTTDLGFSYSVRGDVTDVYQSSTNSGGCYHTSAAYWANGLMNTLIAPGLPAFTYNPDGEGRVATVLAGSLNLVSSTQYNDFRTGWLPQVVTLGSGDSDTQTFDTNTGRMTQYQAAINGSSATGGLTWNGNGSLQQLQVTDPFNLANNQTCAYARDDLARLGQVDCGAPKLGQTFGYDAFGNITKTVMPGHSGTGFAPGYSGTTNHTACTGCAYDANGNLTADGTGGNTYGWDAEGLLNQFNGGTALVYDALGRRVEQTNTSGTREILYSPDGSKLALMNGQTSTQAFVKLAGGATAVYSGGTLAWYRHPDWLGSSRIASTQGQTVYYDGEASYAPFGESPTETGNIDHNFTGQNQDLTSILYDFPAREYHAGEGRWISPDPAGLAAADPSTPQSWNRYAYVLNDPTSNVDPYGLWYIDENGQLQPNTGDILPDGTRFVGPDQGPADITQYTTVSEPCVPVSTPTYDGYNPLITMVAHPVQVPVGNGANAATSAPSTGCATCHIENYVKPLACDEDYCTPAQKKEWCAQGRATTKAISQKLGGGSGSLALFILGVSPAKALLAPALLPVAGVKALNGETSAYFDNVCSQWGD